MGRSTKPRKAYRPRPVDADPTQLAIARAALIPPAQRTLLLRPLQHALDGLRTGTGGWAAWCGMADAMNVAEQLALRGIASDRMPEIQAAQAALQAVHTRQATRNTWTLRADELRALDEGAFFHRVQIKHCTQGEMADAIQAVQRRVSQALAGNAPRDARVCLGALGGQAA
jgi:hypothetical protein